MYVRQYYYISDLLSWLPLWEYTGEKGPRHLRTGQQDFAIGNNNMTEFLILLALEFDQ